MRGLLRLADDFKFCREQLGAYKKRVLERDETIRDLRAQVEAMKVENGELAAGCCVHPETLDAVTDHDTVICGYDHLRAECAEQARLLGMSGEREVKFRAQVDALKAALTEISEMGEGYAIYSRTAKAMVITADKALDALREGE